MAESKNKLKEKHAEEDRFYKMIRSAEEKSGMWKPKSDYSYKTKEEGWEKKKELYINRLAIAKYKRDHCQTLLQKTSLMLRNLMKDIVLCSKSQYVYYNDYYQLKCSELPCQLDTPVSSKSLYGMYLSINVNEHIVDHFQNICEGAALTASADRTPYVRNAFKFVSCKKKDGKILYGDECYIAVAEPGGPNPLYLYCENRSFEDIGLPLQLTLSSNPSPEHYSRFKVMFKDPSLRQQNMGLPINLNGKIVLKHVGTGRNLAAEFRQWVPTVWGAECAVTINTYLDSHKIEAGENIWEVCGGVTVDLSAYIRVAKGEDVPETELL